MFACIQNLSACLSRAPNILLCYGNPSGIEQFSAACPVLTAATPKYISFVYPEGENTVLIAAF